jgi:hypothetical protein
LAILGGIVDLDLAESVGEPVADVLEDTELSSASSILKEGVGLVFGDKLLGTDTEECHGR